MFSNFFSILHRKDPGYMQQGITPSNRTPVKVQPYQELEPKLDENNDTFQRRRIEHYENFYAKDPVGTNAAIDEMYRIKNQKQKKKS